MTEATESPFVRLSRINVNDRVEKKGNLSYLSWSWAVSELFKEDPSANWAYGEPQHWGDTVMVFCSVTAFGKTMTCQLPVMDNRNKAISNPDAFAVNTAMQRCLVKAIALHGLGLYIYAGEDLPEHGEDTFDYAAALEQAESTTRREEARLLIKEATAAAVKTGNSAAAKAIAAVQKRLVEKYRALDAAAASVVVQA